MGIWNIVEKPLTRKGASTWFCTNFWLLVKITEFQSIFTKKNYQNMQNQSNKIWVKVYIVEQPQQAQC